MLRSSSSTNGNALYVAILYTIHLCTAPNVEAATKRRYRLMNMDVSGIPRVYPIWSRLDYFGTDTPLAHSHNLRFHSEHVAAFIHNFPNGHRFLSPFKSRNHKITTNTTTSEVHMVFRHMQTILIQITEPFSFLQGFLEGNPFQPGSLLNPLLPRCIQVH